MTYLISRIFIVIKKILCFLGVVGIISIVQAAPLRVATETSYPPFVYQNDQGEMEGLDIDIAKALCEVLGRECLFVQMPWNKLQVDFNLGTYDIAMSAIDIIDNTEDVIFSMPYHTPSARYIAWEQKNIMSTNLSGLKVGAESGTLFEDYLTKRKRTLHIKPSYFSTYDEAIISLVTGEIDVLLADTDAVQTYIDRDLENSKITQRTPLYTVVGDPLFAKDYGSLGYGIALHHTNTALLAQINDAIKKLQSTGELQRIIKHWLPHYSEPQDR